MWISPQNNGKFYYIHTEPLDIVSASVVCPFLDFNFEDLIGLQSKELVILENMDELTMLGQALQTCSGESATDMTNLFWWVSN